MNFLSVPDIESKLKVLLRENKIEESLDLLFKTVYHLARREDVNGRYVHLKNLDDFIVELSSKISLFRPSDAVSSSLEYKNKRPHCHRPLIVASEFYAHGGHTKVAERINHEHGLTCDVLLTDLYGTFKKSPEAVKSLHDSLNFRNIITLCSDSFLGKILELTKLLREIKPTKIFVIAHHEDVVAYTSLINSSVDIDYIHHCDHTPALGATINYFSHVDLTHELKNACTPFFARPPKFRPLLTADHGFTVKTQRVKEITVSCGSPHKFSGNVPVSYGNIVAQAVTITSGLHYHIGMLSPTSKSNVLGSLEAHGISSERFVNLPWVPSLPKALLTLNASCLIASFPEGGGTTAIETQSTGTPVVHFFNESIQPRFIANRSVYASPSLSWSTPSDFKVKLRLCLENLEHYSRAARLFYERYSAQGDFE
jgi:hypothetical protein